MLACVFDAVARGRSVLDGSGEDGRENTFLIVDPILSSFFPKRLAGLGMSKEMSIGSSS